MSISIITITFNNYEELLKTIDSVEKFNCERIVINGGSCEKTKEFLKFRKDIISISEADRGISDAFNKGISLSKGKGIWFLNSGDISIDEQFLEFSEKNIDHCDFIYSNIVFNSSLYGELKIKPRSTIFLGYGMPYPHQGMIFNRNIFEKVGLFKLDYKITMDFELVCRMINFNMLGKYYPQTVAMMDGNGISSTQKNQSLTEIERSLKENNLMSLSNFLCYRFLWLKTSLLNRLMSIGILKYYRSIKKIFLRKF